MASCSLRLTFFFLALLLAVVSAAPRRGGHNVGGLGVQLSNPDAKNLIADRYIVVYKKTTTDEQVVAHQAGVMQKVKARGLVSRSRDGRVHSTGMNAFSMMGWRAMVLDADNGLMDDIAGADEVDYVEQDSVVRASSLVQQLNAPTGLYRMSHTELGTGSYVFDNSAGTGTVVYVVDTGIRTTHTDFGGRATFAANFVNRVNTDENGHGSHVAGTVGGATFGVAKNVSLLAVKVLDADGAGSNSAVIAGLNFVTSDATARGLSGKAVMNLSLGGSKSNALNSAIAAMVRAGITAVVAAGNENVDASTTSPASAPAAITVGAVDDTTDSRASFSNFGSSVDVFAPGVNVLSVGITSDTASAKLSGTSMASPHVAGLAAYLIALEGLATPDAVTARILALAGASGAMVSKVGSGSTSLLINNGDGQP